MPSTKIINVLKDDSFDEVASIFKETSAKEVIFVLPKKSKAFAKESQFSALRELADEAGRSATFLCSNHDTNELARSYKFEVLLPKQTQKRQRPAIKVVNQIEEKEEPIDTEEIREELEDEFARSFADVNANEGAPAETATIDIPVRAPKGMADIVIPDDDSRPVKVPKHHEDNVDLEVRHDEEYDGLSSRALKEIGNSWKQSPAATAALSRVNYGSTSIWKKWFGMGRTKRKSIDFKNPKSSKKLVTGLMSLALIVFVAIIYISVGSARIEIKPQKKPLDLKLTISASDRYSSIDTAFNRIPGQLFIINKTVAQEFQATGQRDVAQKARGKITIYNELNSPQQLIATTRFVSANGLLFRTLNNVTVPAAKTQPGSIDVEVIADKASPDYNIDPGKFTIPAFKEKGDTVKYQKIYGQSSEKFRGGTNGKSKVITESDFMGAKEALTERLKNEIKSQLQSEVAGLKVITNDAVTVGNITSSAQIDDGVDSFTMSIPGALKTIGFKEADLRQLLTLYIEKTNSAKAIPEKLELSYGNGRFNTTTEAMEFTVTVKGSTYDQINEVKIASDLSGKSESAIRTYIQGVQSVESAKVILSPFWITSVPKDSKKVHITVIYE